MSKISWGKLPPTFFFEITQYNSTHAHSPLKTHMRKFYIYEHLRRLSWRTLEIDEVTTAGVVGVLPSGSPRGIPRRVDMSRDSPRSERDGARNTKI